MGLSLKDLQQFGGNVLNFVGNNPVTHLAEGVVQAPVQAVLDAGDQLYNHVVAPTFSLPQEQLNQTPLAGVANLAGANGSLRQLVGSGLQTGLELGTGGITGAAEGALTDLIPGLEETTLGRLGTRVASNAAVGAGFGASQGVANGENPGDIAKNAAIGAVTGGAIPVAEAGVKAVLPVVRDATGRVISNGADEAAGRAPVAPEAPQPPQPTPQTPLETEAPVTARMVARASSGRGPIPTTGVPAIDAAVEDVRNQYRVTPLANGTAEDILNTAQGRVTIGARAALGLRKALTNNLSPDEMQAVDKLLDGETVQTTPKAVKVAQALRSLEDQSAELRNRVDPNFVKIANHSPRIPEGGTKGALTRAGQYLGQIRDMGDLFNQKSVFNEHRQLDKFVGPDGTAVVGSPVEQGLTHMSGNRYVDQQGNVFSRQHATKSDLEAAGYGPFERNYGRTAGIYHTDTLALKARSDAINALQADPEAHGLLTTAAPGYTEKVTLGGVDYYTTKANAQALNNFKVTFPTQDNPLWKLYDVPSSVATQAIVINPVIHGMNQLFQSLIAAGNIPRTLTGWGGLAKSLLETNEGDIRDYFEAGGHSPTFGSTRSSWLADLTNGATKVNAKTMAGIELRLRVALFKQSVESGMSKSAALDNIDRFLGDRNNLGSASQRLTLFLHYFRTVAGAVGSQIRHPIENLGANINTVGLAGIVAGVSYAYQRFTGNSNAYVRAPGELGLIKEGITSLGDLQHGDLRGASSIITNRINPVLKEGVQQALNQDFFTGQPVTGGEGGRLGHLVSQLIAPAQTASYVTSGKRSLPEVATNEFGLYTPHAKGYQAAPNLPALNTPGAITSPSGDKTGYQQQQQYFTGLNQLQNAFSGDAKETAVLNDYLARSHDPKTGQTIQNSPRDSINNAGALFADDKLRAGVQAFEKSQPNHDPMWDLSPDQLKLFMQYKAQYTGDAAKKFLLSQATDPNTGGNWIKDLEAKQQTYYNNLPKVPGSKGSEANSQTPTYPKFDNQTQTLLNAYDQGDVNMKSQLLQDYGLQLSTAWNQIAQWTNAMRKAEGAPQLLSYPQASPAVEAILKDYNALPKSKSAGNTDPNTNKERANWIKAHPNEYAQMKNYLAQASMTSLIQNAALAQFQGSTPSQKLLKDIKSVGTYDVVTNPDGSLGLAGTSSAQPGATSGGGSSGGSGASRGAHAFTNPYAYLMSPKDIYGRVHESDLVKPAYFGPLKDAKPPKYIKRPAELRSSQQRRKPNVTVQKKRA